MAQLRDLLVNGSARVVGDLYANLSGNVLNFGTCTTAAGTPEKSVTTKGSFELIDGSKILVLFTNTNTANSPTLNVNNTGAKPIFVDDTNGINKSFLTAQQYYWFVYNEAKDHWRVAGGGTTQITSIQYGGTNNDSFISNRPLFFNGTKIIGSTTNYINDTALAINKTSITSGYNFEVNGKSLFNNSVVIAATTDISGTAANAAPLIIGSQTGQHLEFDGNEIMSKSNGTTAAKLIIQTDGGYTYFGSGGVGINGTDTSHKLYVNGTSLFKGNVTHNGIVYFANGTTYYVNNSADGNLRDVSVNTLGISSISGSGLGISLYGGPNPNGFADYGISYAQVADGGSFGDVTNDNSNSHWATYFTIAKTLDNDDKEVRKGWIWRGDNADTAATMSAALSNRGVFTARAITAPTNYIAFPQNGTFSYANDKTGILIIQLPQTKTNTCIRFDVQIYSYEGSKKSLATYHIGGCNANNVEGWKDLQAYSTGDGILSNLNVRFGLDANENAIITIGEIITNWSSPKIAITNLIVGNNNSGADNEAIDKWSYGWVVNISDSNPMASTAESITSPKDDILYSGMNLLPNTQYMDGWSGDNYTENLPINYCRGKRLNIGSTSLSNNISISYNNAFEPEPNTWYTLSFWAKANKNIKLYSYFESAAVAEGYNSSMYVIDSLNNGQIANDITNTWQRYWICWKTNSSTSGYKNITILQLLGTQVNTNVIVILPKLEKGRIPSDWTRNPGDAVHLYGMTGDSSYLQSGGGYNLEYNNLVLHGGLEGVSGIAFLSQSGNLGIGSPSDRAFIQYHAKGVTAVAEGSEPTEATSGEVGRFIIGVGNDAADQIWLQAVGINGIKHQIGENSYTIADTHNTDWDPTKSRGWSTGTLNNGPTLSLVLGDVVKETAPIPAATDLASGVITAVAQRIGGDKTFTGSLLAANNSSKDIGAAASTWRNVYATTYFGSLKYSLTLERNSENPVSFSNSANVSYNVGSVVQDFTGTESGNISIQNADLLGGYYTRAILDNNFTNINTDISNINADITNINTDISNINADITNINTDISNINTDISNIQNRFGANWISGVDLNTMLTSGLYWLSTNLTNSPATWCGLLVIGRYDTARQTVFASDGYTQFYRILQNGTWTSWVRMTSLRYHCLAQVTTGGDQTYTGAIVFNQIIQNIGNCYNASTGIFTCPIDGIYAMSFGYYSNSAAMNSRPAIMVNGSMVAMTNGPYGHDLSITRYCVAGDKITAGAYGASYPVYLYAGGGHNHFSVTLVS